MYKITIPHKTNFRVSDSVKSDTGVTIPVIEGILSESEVVSPNGYRYRKSFWPKVLSEPYVKDMIRNRECLGTVEHPESDSDYLKTPYTSASHVVLSVVLDHGNPRGKFGLLNNKLGNDIKALIEVGVPVGVSTRGLGEESRDEISSYIDENQYALITWDIVKSPNFENLRLNQVSDSLIQNPLFSELSQAFSLRDSRSTDYDSVKLAADLTKLTSELQNILTKLKPLQF